MIGPKISQSVMLLILLLFHSNADSSCIDANPVWTIKSKVIIERIGDRFVSIYLPPGYNDSQNYKVVYMLDGNAIFGIKPDLEKLLNRLIAKNKIDPIVLVGVHSTLNRTSDLVPYFDQEIIDYGGPYRPNAALFSKELHDVIMPQIESKYAVSSNAMDKALFGFSHGALFSLWEVSGNQKTWGMVASMSPSYWVKDYQIYKDIKEKGLTTSKIWYDVGTGEWHVIYQLIGILNEQGLEYGREHFYYEDKDAEHLYGHMLERLPYPLMIFAGGNDYTPVGMKIIPEYIPSRRTTKIYQLKKPALS
jgi:enterochelin esterase-like enzyme